MKTEVFNYAWDYMDNSKGEGGENVSKHKVTKEFFEQHVKEDIGLDRLFVTYRTSPYRICEDTREMVDDAKIDLDGKYHPQHINCDKF